MQHTMADLYQMQALPLSAKIRMTMQRVETFIDRYGEDGVYISFSGGKDSTVLLDLVRREYPNIPAVFVDTGLEYPEIREFVKTFQNVEWLRPKMNFKQVISKYGYPFISKEVSNCVAGARKYIKALDKRNEAEIILDRQTDLPYAYFLEKLTGTGDYAKIGTIPSTDIQEGSYRRAKRLHGEAENRAGGRSKFNMKKYEFLLDAPFEISDKCCNVMKKQPAREYGRRTGRKPILATMACESQLRTQKWLQYGCNAFGAKHPGSNPMSFWIEQDVLKYILYFDIDICSVYGDITDAGGRKIVKEDIDIRYSPIFDDRQEPQLRTSMCDRTGCMFCGFGCHLEKGTGRFERMKTTHPRQYEYIMKRWEDGGLGYKDAIDWMNENGDLDIRY